MAKKLVINGTEYDYPEMDFNAICDLQENGVDVFNPKSMSKKPILTARAIVAWALGIEVEEAGEEIQKHILNGGSLDGLFTGFFEVVEDSGFFKSLRGRNEKTVELQDHKRKQKTAVNA